MNNVGVLEAAWTAMFVGFVMGAALMGFIYEALWKWRDRRRCSQVPQVGWYQGELRNDQIQIQWPCCATCTATVREWLTVVRDVRAKLMKQSIFLCTDDQCNKMDDLIKALEYLAI